MLNNEEIIELRAVLSEGIRQAAGGLLRVAEEICAPSEQCVVEELRSITQNQALDLMRLGELSQTSSYLLKTRDQFDKVVGEHYQKLMLELQEISDDMPSCDLPSHPSTAPTYNRPGEASPLVARQGSTQALPNLSENGMITQRTSFLDNAKAVASFTRDPDIAEALLRQAYEATNEPDIDGLVRRTMDKFLTGVKDGFATILA